MTKRRTGGMILVEAIAATVIISVSLTLIMQSLLGSYRGVTLQKDYTQALIILENHLSGILFDSLYREDKNLKTSSEKFVYGQNLKETSGALKTATLDVSWSARSKRRELSIQTFVYEPSDDKNQTIL